MAKKKNTAVIALLDAEEFDYLKALELYFTLPVKGGHRLFPRIPGPNDIARMKAILQDFRMMEVLPDTPPPAPPADTEPVSPKSDAIPGEPAPEAELNIGEIAGKLDQMKYPEAKALAAKLKIALVKTDKLPVIIDKIKAHINAQ